MDDSDEDRKNPKRNWTDDSDDDRKRKIKKEENNMDVICELCNKKYKNIKYLNQHLQSHGPKRQCELCGSTFVREDSLRKHKGKIHGVHQSRCEKSRVYACDVCSKTFQTRYNLTRHTAKRHKQRTRFTCRHCGEDFNVYRELFDHVQENHPLNQGGGRGESTPKRLDEIQSNTAVQGHSSEDKSGLQLGSNHHTETRKRLTSSDSRTANDESAIRNGVRNRIIYPRANEKYDALTFLGNVRTQIAEFLRSRARQLGGIKWNLCLQVEMQRDSANESDTSQPFFRSRTYFTLSANDDIEHELNEAMQKIHASIEKYIREGSGWFVKKVLKLEVHSIVYKPVAGSGFIRLPKTLAKSGSILNIHNQDDKCFLYCVIASLHPTENQPAHAQSYTQYEGDLNKNGIDFPVTLSQIDRFENQNEDISVNVFTFDDDILPLRITKQNHRLHHVNLLMLKDEETTHYCLITDLNRFLSRTKSNRNQTHFCPFCLHGFTKEASLREHLPYCSPHGPQRVELPVRGENDVLRFKEYEKTLKVPFVIYADFETINVKIDTCTPDPNQSTTTPMTKLEVCGFSYMVVCEDKRYSKPTVVYRGEDACSKLIESLLEEQAEIQDILSNIEPLDVGLLEDDFIEKATHCCLCKSQFTHYDKLYSRIVRHHNHFTGALIDPACSTCNLSCKQANFIPVIFHNLRNFDAHILCEKLGHYKDHKLKCIAQNSERYVSFSLGRLRFIDSFQFLPSSLETLTENLTQDGLQAFPYLLDECQTREKAELLLRKGVYPYDYMDSFEKFEEKELPALENFYSNLKREHISVEDYKHAQNVFRSYSMSSLGQYHDLYLKTDVLLLCSVFESFRNQSLIHYELDPCHFYTSPGLSWASCLKMTNVQLELLTDIDMVLMIEAGIRGGLSQISNRYKKANNPLLDDYNPSENTSYLQYLDANNLYGLAMVQPLPVGDFKFLDENEISAFDIMSVSEKENTRYILKVSLHYPKDLHDLHNCLPLAPEQRTINDEELSPYAKHLLRKLYGIDEEDPLPSRGRVPKLIATLNDKDHYVLHFRNLKLYIKLGMRIKTIHRILQFRQEAWMKPYIDFNTEMRRKATSAFEKSLYKLFNVAVFGKTMENVRKHKDIELVHTEDRLLKVSAKPTYKNCTIFNKDLVAVELLRAKVTLSKPSYSGMCILDLSKYLMYTFWYTYIKTKYQHSAQLQMTDTDSLLFYCETEDLYADMWQNASLFDTSDYPQGHPLQNDRNKKTLGKMKDETNGVPISEFVGLRSKMYSFLCGQKEEKRAKGISKVTVKKDLKHAHYKDTLFNETQQVSVMHHLRSHRHELFGEVISKRGLSAFDDKRYLINNTESYAYGHYRIQNSPDGENKDKANPEVVRQNPAYYVGANKEGSEEEIVCRRDMVSDEQFQTLDDYSFTIGHFKVTPCI